MYQYKALPFSKMSSNSESASKQAVVDVSVLPKNVPSLCIPRMFPNITKERILQVFGDLDICEIDHIDMIPKTSPTGEKFQRVFIHMAQWKNNPQAVRARARVLEGKEIKIIYDDPWFWKVSANRSSPNQNAVVVPNIRNSTQKARVFMDLDCDNDVNNNKPPRNNNNPPRNNNNNTTNTNKYNNKNMNAPPNNNQNRGKYTKILTKPATTATATATATAAATATATAPPVASTTVATPILTLTIPTVDTTTVFEPSSPTSPPPGVAVKTEIDNNIVLVKRRPRAVVTKVKEVKEEKKEEGEEV
jgi:hypothetical protein